jgi:hypothetical protein
MKIRLLTAMVFSLALSAVYAQDAPPAPPAGQGPAQGPGQGGWQGQRGGRGGMMGRAGMGGNGVMGTVTAVAADHYNVKTEAGETYTVYFSANTHILKAPVQRGGPGGPGERMGGGQGMGRGQGAGMGGSSAQELKPADVKVGDAVAAMGNMDPAAKTVGAITVVQFDPEQARMMRERQASFGKTWLQGKVTAIDGVKVSVFSSMDNAAHVFAADENTTFRKRRDPVTLADVQVGDTVRVEGAIKNGSFVATEVMVMGMPGGAPPMPPPPARSPGQPQPN